MRISPLRILSRQNARGATSRGAWNGLTARMTPSPAWRSAIPPVITPPRPSLWRRALAPDAAERRGAPSASSVQAWHEDPVFIGLSFLESFAYTSLAPALRGPGKGERAS